MLVGAIPPWLPRLTLVGSPILVGANPPWLPRLWVAPVTDVGRFKPPVVAPVVGRQEGAKCTHSEILGFWKFEILGFWELGILRF